MIKVRSVRERYEIQERCLKERLERIVPQAMEQSGADIWLHVSREYNEDPTFRALFPPMYPTARRLTILAFVKTDEGVRRFHVAMPDEDLERFYERSWIDWREEPQMAALQRLFEEYQPRTIAVDRSKNFAVADGLSAGCEALLLEGLDETWTSRMYADDVFPIKVMELRTPTEMELMPEVADVSYSILEEMYTSEVVKPGITTTQDLEFFMRQRAVDLGLEYWFEPTMDIERAGVDESRITGVIEPGDLLHCDFGIRYMNMMTDSQRLAYVARPGETEIPSELARTWCPAVRVTRFSKRRLPPRTRRASTPCCTRIPAICTAMAPDPLSVCGRIKVQFPWREMCAWTRTPAGRWSSTSRRRLRVATSALSIPRRPSCSTARAFTICMKAATRLRSSARTRHSMFRFR